MIVLTVGDSKPDINLRLRKDGEPFDLTDVDHVEFRLRKPDGTVVTKMLSVVGDPALGKVSGSFSSSDLSAAGDTFAELVVVWPDGSTQHAISPFRVYIRPEYAEVVE